MPLNLKQQRFVEEFFVRKVAALRQLTRRLGMKPDPSLLTNAQKWILLIRLVDESILPVQRAACAFMLDMVSADWRSIAGPEIMGHVVDRDSPEARRWRGDVIANDNGQCRKCGATDHLHAHHIVRWADAPHLRITPSNGMTLCEGCHVEEHRRCG